ncbi:glucose-repressible alcohol dehydrogenase transcriptional effector [Punctularia strigosozonata HHB-11173 SS5]|uniref:glucose-repressible alcohol dehydrogenase transcriptional effector n=1 Tax=Punctularia strigosozonata (strain HHB-11173) TaxID=741275 RepID=UPI0004417ECE|nr:glucose-repressible alcohol dehydrogenase transcriptional effector [Punctularia strigosozonata HHB-11173 SS5]EIN12059.1 glucose-repressible alcohol dehydrogenase transcriptional effector [Punctularia strigosozonata HHB-11173 SS5]
MQHHHQNSLTSYTSPPNGHTQSIHALAPPTPGSAGQVVTPHWQQQLIKYETIRASRSPHHRARASAMASRTVAKSAIPITNPNAIPIKPPADANGNGVVKDDKSAASSAASEGSPGAAATSEDHPSSIVGPIQEQTRPAGEKQTENTWHSLDMGGIMIKNIPPTSGLFAFTFLTNLYLNHNQLSRIPPQISRLRHLELLDLSGNLLTALPEELGMLTELKELYVFDNKLTTLPHQLGTLHQLQTLGIEGNPLDESLKKIVQTEGTSTLISYLRDNCPRPDTPPPRVFHSLISPAEREAMQSDPNVETLTVLCFNVLCERAATERLYGYTPSWALQWDYRKELIMAEITNYDADVLCLQEVDIGQYEDFFVPLLAEQGYDGVYWPKSRHKTMSGTDRRMVDGCATFFKASKFQLVEKHLIEFSTVAMQRPDFKKTDDMFNRILVRDNIAVVCLLENRDSGTRFIIANAHLHWDARCADVKLVQTALLVEETEKIADNFARYPPRPPQPQTPGSTAPPQRPPPMYSDGTKIPTLICGDFNSVPGSGVYEFLSNGSVPPDHPDWLSHVYGRYTSDGVRHRLGLKSVYQSLGELPMTNYTANYQGTLDYIWYSTQNLSVSAVLSEVDRTYLEKVVGFPNTNFPSDHICIAAELRVRPPRDSHSNRPPPVFPP